MKHKILTWAVIAFLIFFASKNPHSAAHIAQSIGSGLADAAAGLGTFLEAVV